MARKVFVSSDMSVDERLTEVAEHDPLAALLWPWMLTAFDDWGRCEVNPRKIKARVFPTNQAVDAAAVEQAFSLYAQTGLLELYEVEGKRYAAIDPDKWFKYQTHIRREKRDRDLSRHPAPPRADARTIAQSRANASDIAHVRDYARTDAQPRADYDNRATESESEPRADARSRAQVRDSGTKSVPSPSTLPPFHPSPSVSNEPEEREGADAPATPSESRISAPRQRPLTEEALDRLQDEFPDVDVRAAATDYLNWSGSSKHRDKVLGLRNQLKSEAVRRKFPRKVASKAPADDPFGNMLVFAAPPPRQGGSA